MQKNRLIEKIEKRKRRFFAEDFKPDTWDNVKPELEKLLVEKIGSAKELIEFWKRVSEFDRIIEDYASWLYIRMTQYADKAEHIKAFNDFVADIGAKCQPYENRLKQKFYDSPFRKELSVEYDLLNLIIANDIELFRQENVALSVKEQELENKYGEITSKMTVEFDGEEKTIQQLAPYLEKQDCVIRENAWRAMFGRYAEEKEKLNELFDELKLVRMQMAKNAGFDNYRDYMHRAKGRFSYSPKDLLKLHEAVEKEVVPLIEEFGKKRKERLGLDILRPWDFNVDIEGEMPKPFSTHEELVAKGVETIYGVDQIFGDELHAMQKSGFVDAENRKGKAPIGYCNSLYEYGSSFIFMHAVGVRRDVETFVHEAGHAMHNLMDRNQDITQYLQMPMEIAELASMGMELLSLEKWKDVFYAKGFLRKISKSELEDKIKFLPWGVVVDAFQHWIYLNPEHTAEQREKHLMSLLDRFKIGGDWTGLEKEKALRWMLQSHIFQRPFYYIEYVMAQLGAIAIYRNYKKDPKKTIEQYKKFLSLGYSKPVNELYEAAGIKFDFSAEYIRELVQFVREELALLEKEENN